MSECVHPGCSASRKRSRKGQIVSRWCAVHYDRHAHAPAQLPSCAGCHRRVTPGSALCRRCSNLRRAAS